MINKLEAERQADSLGSSEAFSGNEFEQVSPLVVAKIYLNIALIRTQMGFLSESV